MGIFSKGVPRTFKNQNWWGKTIEVEGIGLFWPIIQAFGQIGENLKWELKISNPDLYI